MNSKPRQLARSLLPDALAWMVQALSGKALPPLPATPGRRCRPLGEVPDDDPIAEAWEAQHAPALAEPAQPEAA